jgi:hypothetical protein
MRRIFVIYERPADYPHIAFVLREHLLEEQGKVTNTANLRLCSTLAKARAGVPKGCIRHDRKEKDISVIVEWWEQPSDK